MLKTVCSLGIGAPGLLDEAAARMLRMVDARSGKAGVFRTEGRFVTGLGRSHPVENGFAWHPTLGTPYLPGSSVKGLIRAWAQSDAAENQKLQIAQLLGEPGRIGEILALDAIPIEPVRLSADVMTPHYHGWNEHDPPADWRSPNPIPFLVTESGAGFVFSLVPRSKDGEAIGTVWSWLLQALEFSGAGAKTAVGYGRFIYDDNATAQWRNRLMDNARARGLEAARREMLKTPEGRWRLQLEGKSEAEILEQVRLHLEKQPLADPMERAAFISAVRATGLPELWRKGKKREAATQVGEKKLKERARLLR